MNSQPLAPCPGCLHDRSGADVEALPDDVELDQPVDALGARWESGQRLQVEVARVSYVGHP